MASKTISITEEIYNQLSNLKDKDESFTQLFCRMINLYQKNLEESFGAWNLSNEDFSEIWGDITERPGRKFSHSINE